MIGVHTCLTEPAVRADAELGGRGFDSHSGVWAGDLTQVGRFVLKEVVLKENKKFCYTQSQILKMQNLKTPVLTYVFMCIYIYIFSLRKMSKKINRKKKSSR